MGRKDNGDQVEKVVGPKYSNEEFTGLASNFLEKNLKQEIM